MSTALMASRKKRNTKGAAIAQAILEQYQPQTMEDMQEAIKDIFGPMFEAMLQGEMDSHLGYEANDHGYKDTDNRRNGYISKNVKTAYGELPVDIPRDRQATFEPQVIPKRTRDVSGIEDKVMSMYARGMSQRDIADTIEDIYGFESPMRPFPASQTVLSKLLKNGRTVHLRNSILSCLWTASMFLYARKWKRKAALFMLFWAMM